MKKMLLLVLTVLFAATFSYSQITVKAGSANANKGDTVTIPINVTNFNSISAITIAIKYDTSAVSWLSLLNNDPQIAGILSGAKNGVVTASWEALNGMTLATGKLFDLKFISKGGSTALTFDTVSSEIADTGANVLKVTYTNGVITGPFSGSYYIGAAGTGPNKTNPTYTTLKSAITAINGGTIGGDCTFYITSNLTEPVNAGLGVNTNGYNLTFKPYAGTVDTVTFTQTTDNAGASGGLAIGIADLSASTQPPITTKNVTIDGSNTVNGTTRDLTFRTISTTHKYTNPIRLFGDISNITLKNIKIVAGQDLLSYGLLISNRNASSVNYTPKNITINNCEITNTINSTGQGIGISNSGTPTTFPTGIVISNNIITGTSRGIFLNYAGSTDINNNKIIVNQPNGGYISSYIYCYVIGSATSTNFTTNIYNNNFASLTSANSAAANGITGIWVGSTAQGAYNIYNNFIGGFVTTTTTANPSFVLKAISIENAAAVAKIVNNSIYLPDVNYTKGTGSLLYTGIYLSKGVDTVENNIIYSAEATDTTYAIYKVTDTTTTTVIRNNDYYATTPTVGLTGYWKGAIAKTLADWKTASGQDSTSISVDPGFTSATDLHLKSNTSPVIGKGIVISWLSTDIDGDKRDTPPELGADEIPGVVPVELTSFSASYSNNAVSLKWSTATETNNASFVVEKKTAGSDWASVAVINGHGTTATRQNYSYVDSKISSSKITYRLRQNDYDGSYSYSKEIEVAANSVPQKFALNQNYPNPFNPSTIISFSVPVDSKVKLEVYSITGQLVATLFDGYKTAGNYEINMKANNLSSGVYIYRLTAGNTMLSKKMQLLK